MHNLEHMFFCLHLAYSAVAEKQDYKFFVFILDTNLEKKNDSCCARLSLTASFYW